MPRPATTRSPSRPSSTSMTAIEHQPAGTVALVHRTSSSTTSRAAAASGHPRRGTSLPLPQAGTPQAGSRRHPHRTPPRMQRHIVDPAYVFGDLYRVRPDERPSTRPRWALGLSRIPHRRDITRGANYRITGSLPSTPSLIACTRALADQRCTGTLGFRSAWVRVSIPRAGSTLQPNVFRGRRALRTVLLDRFEPVFRGLKYLTAP